MNFEQCLDISLDINFEDNRWICYLRDLYKPVHKIKANNLGTIEGDISRDSLNRKCFQVTTSELNKELRGRGLGMFFYELCISKILHIDRNITVKSSISLNEYSTGIWEALSKKYSNIYKSKNLYIVENKKSI